MVTNPWSQKDVTEYIQVDTTELEIIHPLFHEALGDVKGKSVVDYGCGQGKLLSEMITREAKVYGYDISSSIIEEARGSLGNKAILEVIESGRIPLEDSSVDAVVSNLVLMMCPSVDSLRDVFLEVGRVVKPGG